jgi:hypothetical protein
MINLTSHITGCCLPGDKEGLIFTFEKNGQFYEVTNCENKRVSIEKVPAENRCGSIDDLTKEEKETLKVFADAAVLLITSY